MSVSIYKEVLMDHYHHPRNRGDVSHADVIRRGRNPRCGDDLEIGVTFEADTLTQVLFHGRGCSVCMASASMMTEAVSGKSKQEAHQLAQGMKAWFTAEGENPAESLQALEAVRGHSARKRCVLLAWEALDDALAAE